MHENRNYQRELAECLVRAIGIDEALEFARSNHWDGVLDQIQSVEGRVIYEGEDVLH